MQLNGCALEVYRANGARLYVDGVRPVAPQSQNLFRYQDCDAVATWRFLGSLNYSDDPNDLSVVLFDTGQRPKTKCDYDATFSQSMARSIVEHFVDDAEKRKPHHKEE